MKKIFLGIGSSLGDRIASISGAVSLIEQSVGRVVACSSVYETDPWGFNSQDRFLNLVVACETGQLPLEVLSHIQQIESQMGRLRRGNGYSSRTIDIDILFFGDEIIFSGSLVVPHPRLHERKFVLIPLAEIAADLIHPVLRKKATDLLADCTDSSGVSLYQPAG